MKDESRMSLPELQIHTEFSVSTLYRYMDKKSFPRGVKIAGKVYWKKQDVDTWLSTQLNKGNNNEIEIR